MIACPTENEDVPFNTKEFNVTRSLNNAREGFTGRHWLYRDLESLLLNSQGNSVRGAVVVGDLGSGKSALMAQLICSPSSNAYIHERMRYHLCKYYDEATQDPGRFVRNLVDLIARRIPEYGMLISNTPSILEILQQSCFREPYYCYEQAIATPLQTLNYNHQHYFMIVDALDECSAEDVGISIAKFVKDTYKKLTKWMHLIMTSRNDSSVMRHLSSLPKLYLSSKDTRNLQDIEIFTVTKLLENATYLEWLKVMLGFSPTQEISYVTKKLVNQSQGNFLFAREMLHFWEDGQHGDIDLNQLPKTMDGQYESYLKRTFGSRERFKPALAVLEVLVAAFKPMKMNDVFEVLRISETIDYSYEYDFIYTLQTLSHYITYEVDNTITFYHQYFKEWLTSSENIGRPNYVSRSRGHRRPAEYYLSVVRKTPNNTMDIYHLEIHISQGEQSNRVVEEFKNINESYVNATIDNNKTLLHLAAVRNDAKVLQLLSLSFKNFDCEDIYGLTPAFLAAKDGFADNVEFLISKGANVDTSLFWRSTMMHVAAVRGHSDVVQLLLERNASFTSVNAANFTALQLAALNGHLNVIQLLYNQGAPADHFSLQYAAYGGHADVVAFLLEVGVEDTCICMRCDRTLELFEGTIRLFRVDISFHTFKTLCQSALFVSVAKNHINVAKVLLLRDHKIRYSGRSLLHEAVRRNDVEIAELLKKWCECFSGKQILSECVIF